MIGGTRNPPLSDSHPSNSLRISALQVEGVQRHSTTSDHSGDSMGRRLAQLHRGLVRGIGACVLGGSLLMGGFSLSGCVKNTGSSPAQTELTVEIIGTVKGGQGSGVVGGPVAGVNVVATANGKTIGPVTTDAAGGFTLNGLPFLAEGTQTTPAGLKAATPVSVDLKFSREGFKTQVEVVTLPFPKTQDMTFYLSGE